MEEWSFKERAERGRRNMEGSEEERGTGIKMMQGRRLRAEENG